MNDHSQRLHELHGSFLPKQKIALCRVGCSVWVGIQEWQAKSPPPLRGNSELNSALGGLCALQRDEERPPELLVMWVGLVAHLRHLCEAQQL